MSEEKQTLPLLKIAFLLLAIAAVIFAISLTNAKVRFLLLQAIKPFQPADVIEKVEAPKPKAIPREEPQEETTPPQKALDLDHLSNGLTVHKAAYYKTPDEESPLASEARTSDEYYNVSVELEYALPRPAVSLEELQKNNANLGKILPWLGDRLGDAHVAPYFSELYQQKVDRVKKNQAEWRRLLTTHHAYDTQTILEIPSEDQSQGMLLIQSEMDVVSDGTDGDRMPHMPKEITESSNYQPFTSYGWKKTTDNPNPLLSQWKKKLSSAKPGSHKEYLGRAINDMERRSFLIAEHDPFIVIPVNYLKQTGAWAPSVGDYAVVIYQDKLYPAIVGDGGPSYKMGEASLRIARAVNEKSTPYNRPVEHLEITYLVFTQSATKPFYQPNYETWKVECEKLLQTMGGLGEGYSLESWKSLF